MYSYKNGVVSNKLPTNVPDLWQCSDKFSCTSEGVIKVFSFYFIVSRGNDKPDGLVSFKYENSFYWSKFIGNKMLDDRLSRAVDVNDREKKNFVRYR
jgi:hypothetical protein